MYNREYNIIHAEVESTCAEEDAYTRREEQPHIREKQYTIHDAYHVDVE